MSDYLHYMTATEQLRRFKTGELSPVDVLKAQIAQRERVNPSINAITESFDEQALNAAHRAGQAYANGTARPLEGLTCAIKDETFIEGQVTTNGSLLLKEDVASSTDPVPQRLMDAGAIVHHRTCTPEFSVAAVTWSKLWGVTRNPWNPVYTPGGSTGGGAASLAAGMTTLANATDIGGSIRIPASQCGVLGFKASYGRIPEIYPYNIDSYCHHGLLARSVADAVLMYNCISGPADMDIVSQLPKQTIKLNEKDLTGLRIALSLDMGFYEIVPEVRANTLQAAQYLRECGAEVISVDINLNDSLIEMARIHQGYLNGALLKDKYQQPQQIAQLCSYTKWHIEKTGNVSAEQLRWANQQMQNLWLQFANIFKDYDAFICPTVAQPEVAADFDYSKDSCVINGQTVDANKGWFMTYPFNALGRCPVLSLPSGFSAQGVPTGIQLVAKPYEDQTAMQIGANYERQFPAFSQQGIYPQL